MFENTAATSPSSAAAAESAPKKYKMPTGIFPAAKRDETHTVDNYSKIDQLLEKEKQHNKTESWNKLDKTIKMQKLHCFAEKYGKDNALANKDVKALKAFFKECLEKNKLQKTKDVTYDKDNHEINAIPSLFFNPSAKNFTLKNIDPKRVSTLKSLTPKRNVLMKDDDDEPSDALHNEQTNDAEMTTQT
jgi:hypothetical protein